VVLVPVPAPPAFEEADDAARVPVDRRAGALAGPFARFSANNSAARSGVTVSTASSLRSVAFVVPSVTYGPNRPSLTTIGLPETGSGPSSRNGAAALAPRPRLGWA